MVKRLKMRDAVQNVVAAACRTYRHSLKIDDCKAWLQKMIQGTTKA